jgi:hypothetical protein
LANAVGHFGRLCVLFGGAHGASHIMTHKQ